MTLIIVILCLAVLTDRNVATNTPRRIHVDTDVDTDDLFAILYLLKQNRSEFNLKSITVSANSWTDAGHAVNHMYDLLYMMDRDDIPVGIGGEGGISYDGTIFPNVGGYLAIIEQGMTTVGNCRYRQAIPRGGGGLLDIDTNYGFRKGFLPQGERKYTPQRQPTAQQVLIDTISEGPTTLFLIGVHTNIAVFLMSNPHLKKNIEHIYIMGGGVRSSNPTGCCAANDTTCIPGQCSDHGNMFSAYGTNPNAEFNMFGDPFAAYQVFHSGIPITLVPLDATNTIPITENFFKEFERQQSTYEAQYSFRSLKITRDTWFNDKFYTSFFMWDSFMAGIAVSIMKNGEKYNGDNDFAEMEYMNITVVTSNMPYGINDGSNPFFDGRQKPRFNLLQGGVHSGHVQNGIDDPFCIVNGSTKGKCEDGYTKEVTGPEAVEVLVATKAKPSRDVNSPLEKEYFKHFLEVLNLPQHAGRFNISTQFPYYRETLYLPNFSNKTRGRPVIFDMDMSAGDFLSLIYLLKAPIEDIDLKAILVSGDGWADAATIDIIYDVLHMMGRDDIPVGLGNLTALGTSSLGCTYFKAIPLGSSGYIESDTLYGLARDLPRSPRRYTAENSVKYGAPRDTDHPELRQPLAFEVWESVSQKLNPGEKISFLTNGPLTNLATIILSDTEATSKIESIVIVGGHVASNSGGKGNVYTVPSNNYAEFNFFLDPQAAKTVIQSGIKTTLVPLVAQRKVASFQFILRSLQLVNKTAELNFAYQLLSLMNELQKKHQVYNHMDIFIGEILGSIFLVEQASLKPVIQVKQIDVIAGEERNEGQLAVDNGKGKQVNILESLDTEAYYAKFASALSQQRQTALISSFDEQKKIWSKPPA
ncbi:Pyrimidine-specific ribonucleoside hydrolase RihA [Rhynchospora pubera]|uniref:Pyrimidine-specific ribonucleoside hydrolase RihA n=1 Tax=Rhynchospora pubera TaxID=906938 RepID=A0AAV8FCX6_9POAL|nr:Pyrimidine-specific ribonucleoside hydrolase RihA [Rhynchospora pubera]